MFSFGRKDGKLVSPLPEWARFFILGSLLILPVVFWVFTQVADAYIFAGVMLVAVAALLPVVSFRAGLVALVVFLPLEPLVAKFIPEFLFVYFRLVPEALIAGLAVSSIIKLMRAKKENAAPKINPIAFPVFVFAGIALISLLFNRVDAIVGLVGLRQLLRFIVIYFALYFYGLSNRDILKIAGLVAALSMFESALGLLQAAFGSYLDNLFSTGKTLFVGRFRVAQEFFQNRVEGERVFATMGRYDQLGTFLSLTALAALGFAYEAFNKQKKTALMVLLLALPTLVFTYSRASWFGFLIGLIAVAVFIKKDRRVLAGLFILLIALGGYVAYKEVEVRRLIDEPEMSPINRLLEAFSEKRFRGEYTAKGRLYFILETPPAVMAKSPVLGVGPGQYGSGAAAVMHNTTAYDEMNLPFGIYGVEGTIDNNWMSIFGETGLLGVLAYIAIFIMLLRFAWKAYQEQSDWLVKALSLGLIGATLSFMFQGFLGNYFEVRTIAPYYWILAAITVLAYNNAKNNHAHSGNQ